MIKNILYLSIFTTIVVICSVVLSVYHSFSTNTISTDTSIQVTPIPSGFDFSTVDDIKKRKAISVDLTSNMLSSGSAEITPEPSPIPTTIPVKGSNPLISPSPEISAPASDVTSSSSADTTTF